MEGAGFLESKSLGDIADARIALTQLLKGHATAYFVLDLLIGTAFTLQFAAEGAGTQVLFQGKGLQRRPFTVVTAAQALMNLRGQAMLVRKRITSHCGAVRRNTFSDARS